MSSRPTVLVTVLAITGIVLLALALLGMLPGLASFAALPGSDRSVEAMTEQIRAWGNWGVLGSLALMVAHSFLPFPAEFLALANGMVYGPVWGSVVTWVGAMLGAAVAFGLARRFGQPFVKRLLSPSQQARLAAWSHERGASALLVARLIPAIAFNLINFAAALTGISWRQYLWATAIGILPLSILLAVLGDRMLTLPPWAWWLSLAVAALVAICLLLRRHWRSGRK